MGHGIEYHHQRHNMDRMHAHQNKSSTSLSSRSLSLSLPNALQKPLTAPFTDCKTDVFFNSASLIFPALGSKLSIWWLDPLGAALLSLFIIYDWGTTCFAHVVRLSGSTASDRLARKVMFVAYRFEALVKGFKSVQAYHAGDGIWVEVDILMEPAEKLIRCHDIAETLQYCLEGLNEVDRAFVTVDCKCGFCLFFD
jgi:divalent metal cation (Fe/Co/Zn/Cd) transporter